MWKGCYKAETNFISTPTRSIMYQHSKTAGSSSCVPESKLDEIKAKYPDSTMTHYCEIAVCTPLMARAHANIPQSAEILFCDSTSSLDRFNTSLFILSTCHPAGGIPLGIVLTSDEKEETITAALHLLLEILPQNAFYSAGVEKGPGILMTDDSSSEKNALKIIWPNSLQLLCLFHFLQRRWTWLWEGQNKIYNKDRASLINLVKPYMPLLKFFSTNTMKHSYKAFHCAQISQFRSPHAVSLASTK